MSTFRTPVLLLVFFLLIFYFPVSPADHYQKAGGEIR